MFEDRLEYCAQQVIQIFHQDLANLWYDYKNMKVQEYNAEMPAKLEFITVVRYCLDRIPNQTKYNKCTITEFLYNLFMENPAFMLHVRHRRFLETCMNKANELLNDDYIIHGNHRTISRVLRRFIRHYDYAV